MPDPSAHTMQLHRWLERMRAGDAAARDELLRAVGGRLERLARKMLRRFPTVQRWADTGDVLQGAVLRLLRALEAVQPGSMRDFFGLAAEQMRRELLDLARHFQGPHGIGAHHATGLHAKDAPAPAPDPPDRGESRDELDRWTRFHEAVEGLPAEEREVIGLVFYHGYSQAEVAELFQVAVRTVQRRWQSACVRLHESLRGELPPR